ncbi:MAG: phage tail tube protein [Methylocystis sp.]|uniref:phage tail tube protein n=1 Tax=Methylocystis sp. TaxID=1911079 RepID=UPI003DA46C7D
MALPDIIRGTYFSLMAGDGGGPETFAALCGITTRNFTHQHNTNDQYTRDCGDPENEPVRRLIVTGEAWNLDGNGTLNRANLATIQALDDGQTHNFRYVFTEPAGDLVYQGYYEGPAIITSLQISATDENFATISISLASDGAWTWTTV